MRRHDALVTQCEAYLANGRGLSLTFTKSGVPASFDNPAPNFWRHTCDPTFHDYYKFSSGSFYLRSSTAPRAPATVQFLPSCRIPHSDFPLLSFSLSLPSLDSTCGAEQKDEDEVSPAYKQFRQPNPQDDNTPPRVLSVRSTLIEE